MLIDFLIRVAHTLEVIKTLCTGTDEVKQKTSLFSVQGKICLALFCGFCFFVLHHLCQVHLVNALKA